MDLADSGQLPRVWPYSGAERKGSSCRIRDCHPLWPNFPERSAKKNLDNSPPLKAAQSYNPIEPSPDGLGYCPFARRYLGSRGCFLFLELLRCFSSLRLPHTPMDSAYV